MTLWGSQGFLYDLNGNMTADGNNAYTWNVRNQLVALTPDGGTANTFAYDAFGRRQKKVINGTETDFLFDQNGNLAAELTDGGEYFTSTDLEGFSPDELVCRYTAGADGGLNQPLMAMTDINGSVVGLVADGGVIQATYAYEPYGATEATGTDNGNGQQYAGRENDGTGLYFNRWRYYMPETGRFVSEDPIGWQGGINVYSYANGNPVQLLDPFGLYAWSVWCSPDNQDGWNYDEMSGQNAFSGDSSTYWSDHENHSSPRQACQDDCTDAKQQNKGSSCWQLLIQQICNSSNCKPAPPGGRCPSPPQVPPGYPRPKPQGAG